MKFVALILFVILSIAVAKVGDPVIRGGPELWKYMAGDLQGTFILMFYKKSAPSSRTTSIRAEIKKKILDKYPFLHYHECDIDSGLYSDVVEDLKVDETELKHSPTVMVASEGIGYWAHGEGAVDDIASSLSTYATELRQ
mmetsp:Transcript_5187/g.5948  ORF Transcript_5187/g.5948 Transcript_5187/m.5948 type:complete len:140 (+) Transcript_5187:43-462(+)